MGTYLGWIYWETGNLAIVVAIHGGYDFVALLLIRRRLQAESTMPESTEIPPSDA